jgi:hypothetical protein
MATAPVLAQKHAGGRPSLYDPSEHPELALKFCLLGATNVELSQLLEVSHATIDNWMREHEEFLGAIKKGRVIADAAVARSLYEQALGGSVVAAIFWLKNRRPAQWSDRREHRLEAEVRSGPIDPARLAAATEEDLKMARAVIRKFTTSEPPSN